MWRKASSTTAWPISREPIPGPRRWPLTNSTLPYALEIADKGHAMALKENPGPSPGAQSGRRQAGLQRGGRQFRPDLRRKPLCLKKDFRGRIRKAGRRRSASPSGLPAEREPFGGTHRRFFVSPPLQIPAQCDTPFLPSGTACLWPSLQRRNSSSPSTAPPGPGRAPWDGALPVSSGTRTSTRAPCTGPWRCGRGGQPWRPTGRPSSGSPRP